MFEFMYYMRICHALLWIQCATGFGRPLSSPTRANRQLCKLSQPTPEVWVQEAETGFVDEEENLEEGEVCHRSVKAFASSVKTSILPRFLGAGALVQRPGGSLVCDAWTADAMLDEGGPNLQLQGACQILDDLLLFHFQQQQERNEDDSILGLQTFVVKCGGGLESEYSCASYMAAMSRGFHPLKEMIRKSSIYSSALYDHDLDGLVMDATEGKQIYQTLSQQGEINSTASAILDLLPDDDTIRRHITKRFTVQQSPIRKRMNDQKLP
eukprot:scaffold45428_cov176-Amphora_coffeaeformis.AAC.3